MPRRAPYSDEKPPPGQEMGLPTPRPSEGPSRGPGRKAARVARERPQTTEELQVLGDEYANQIRLTDKSTVRKPRGFSPSGS